MGERPVPGMVERCESGSEDGTNVVQRRSGVEVSAVGKRNSMIAVDVFGRTFGLPEESFWVWCPIFGIQTVSRRTGVQ